MSIEFTEFTEKHISEAVKLAEQELNAERRLCPQLPQWDFCHKLTCLLHWLSSQPFGKAAVSEGRLVGYMLFASPWDGFFGDVKGVFSPLGGSAFSYEYENRGRLASQLFEKAAEDFVRQGVYSCALSRYADDEETAKAFVLNGLGIRCCDAVGSMTELNVTGTCGNAVFKELSADNFRAVEQLQRGLHSHLAGSPVFFPPDKGFDSWFENWINSKTMRIFTAECDNKTVGFISVDDTAENFITEYEGMKNICGAYSDKAYRQGGLAQSLLAYIRDTLKNEGISHLGVDFETLNPTALNFWGKYFQPYTYSFARRIDERIGFLG